MSAENSIEIESFDDYLKMLQTSEEEKTNNTRDSEKINKDSAMSEKKTVIRRKIKCPKRTENFQKSQSRDKKKKQKRIASISKQIEKNLFHKTRYTEPKKRNLLSRIILQSRLEKGYYEYIEDDYDHIILKELEESKNAKKRSDRSFYKEVQEYEDAKEDVTTRKGWIRFKIGLAAVLLAGSFALGNYVSNEVSKTLSSINPTTTVETMDDEERVNFEEVVKSFVENVKQNSGYEFDYLSDEELQNGYLRIIETEKKLPEGKVINAFYSFKDQDLLDELVKESFDEGIYDSFSDKQKRDYRQLAFELLPIAQPRNFGEKNLYIRNPIVYDELQTKNAAKEKGYIYTIVVNNDEKENVKNIGRIIHIRNLLDESDYISASNENGGQDFLDNIVKQVIGEGFENLSSKEQRDYKQIAYELLPDEAKENYIKDPIDFEKNMVELEIGE